MADISKAEKLAAARKMVLSFTVACKDDDTQKQNPLFSLQINKEKEKKYFDKAQLLCSVLIRCFVLTRQYT